MNKSFITFILSTLLLSVVCVVKSQSDSYKPILLMHGFAISEDCGANTDWDTMLKYIQKNNPDQIAIALDVDNHLKSTKPMFTQINDIYLLMTSILENNSSFANGFHIIAHSQGALLMRSLVEMYGFKVDNFISLAGVHNGVYGVGFTNDYWFGNFTDKELTDLMYSSSMQKEFSVANWWNDPKDNDRYIKENFFLPALNQELSELTPEFKANFVGSIGGSFNAFGSQDDEVVDPWISELFGYYNENMVMIPINETYSYQQDSYGLKTLDSQGKLKLTQVDGVKHADWLRREDLFNQYILPLISK
ncbi:hypothetical protein ACTFIY_001977 [Dictyostelium cf. discoideum]